MKTKFILFLFIFTLLSTFVSPVWARAQEADTATVSADNIQRSIQDRIKKALQDNLKVAQKATNQQAPRLRAFIGKVDTIAENTLTLIIPSTNNNQVSKQVQTTNDTVIVVDGKPSTLGKVSLGSTAIAMGYTTDNQVLHAIRLAVGEIPAPKYTYSTIWGSISDFDTKAKTIDIKMSDGSVQTYGLSKRYNFVDHAFKAIDLKSLVKDQNIIAILITDTTTNVTKIDKMYVWNSTPSPTPSLSTTPTSSPSAKKKTTQAQPICGDGICQDTEAPETCPADCTR